MPNRPKEQTQNISIHALLAESDTALPPADGLFFLFLSTLSLRRATAPQQENGQAATISIHALLAESDPGPKVMTPDRYYFYPRSPCGERRSKTLSRQPRSRNFYPRSPCGERLFLRCGPMTRRYFYPRSPCGERRTSPGHPGGSQRYFYPRSPCGERHTETGTGPSRSNFYPRSPCGERPVQRLMQCMRHDFYPRSPCGERPDQHQEGPGPVPISIHALLAESDDYYVIRF